MAGNGRITSNRPKGRHGQSAAKTQIAKFRVTVAQENELLKAAGRKGMTLSEYLRRKALNEEGGHDKDEAGERGEAPRSDE